MAKSDSWGGHGDLDRGSLEDLSAVVSRQSSLLIVPKASLVHRPERMNSACCRALFESTVYDPNCRNDTAHIDDLSKVLKPQGQGAIAAPEAARCVVCPEGCTVSKVAQPSCNVQSECGGMVSEFSV